MPQLPSPVSVPLLIHHNGTCSSVQPVTLGIPLPSGSLREPGALSLVDDKGKQVLLQTQPLARWPDGSVKWLLLDFLLPAQLQGRIGWKLEAGRAETATEAPGEALRIAESHQMLIIHTGVAEFQISRTTLQPFARVLLHGKDILAPTLSQCVLTDAKGRLGTPRVERLSVEACGPVRCTVLLEGIFTGRVRCRFAARLCFFRGTGLVRVRLTLHNPRRARHPGGLWDLGDAGSMLFRDLSLDLPLANSPVLATRWTAEVGQSTRSADSSFLEIYQDSSGGENWQSRNHVNGFGQVSCSFRGYRVRSGNREESGLRASPTVSVQGETGSVTVAVLEFWQQFPKAIEVEQGRIRVRLFPQQYGDLFELQGGEQKTHTVWLNFSVPDSSPTSVLGWVHEPATVHSTPEWYAASRAIPYSAPADAEPENRLDTYLARAITGPTNLFDRRETIDEYGWRNFGEVYADHEATYYTGPQPVISHYNNQYDVLHGLLLQYLRTGDVRWFALADPLARHVMDIDIYHTTQDKAAYNGGLFWFTDHYKDAATCTHRTYSRHNAPADVRAYGGGPSSNHNFATGFVYYYFLTGDPQARAAVLSLADWVVNMDDGSQNVLGFVDSGPTGLASYTGYLDYQGPGRGAGNSINVLLDAWLVCGERKYLGKAEALLRRCAHPDDDIARLDLLNAEKRWSYTVFLSAIARYVEMKAELGEVDHLYAYARATLIHYATWMLDHERPSLDRADQLEYPTETWAAQEFRKANVLRLAARHVGEPLCSRLVQRADELVQRGWADLCRFPTQTVMRALALLMVEGTKEASFHTDCPEPLPRPREDYTFGKPTTFVPQRLRIRAQIKSGKACVHALIGLTNVRQWWRLWSRSRA
jgi:hypothetical protein